MEKVTTEIFIKRAQERYGDRFDYSKTRYINCRTKVCIVCPEHGEFWIRPDGHLKGNGCPKCGYKKIGEKLRLTREQFIQKAEQLHGDKYDYSEVDYIDSFSPVKIICPNHGLFYQTPSAHIHLKEGCPQCSIENKRKSTQQFIKEASQIHNNKYSYDKVIYLNKDTKVVITCPIHGDFEQSPGNHLQGHGCPMCKDSLGEKLVSDYLNDHCIQFNRQVSISCPNYVRSSGFIKVDFFGQYQRKDYIIEYNGQQHYELTYFGKGGKFEKQQFRDQWLREYCKNNNIQLLEIPYSSNITQSLNQFFDTFK